MSQPLQRIQRFLRRMVLRERALLVLLGIVHFGMIGCVVLMLATALHWMGVKHGTGWFYLVLVMGLGLWMFVIRLFSTRWGKTGDVSRQAILMEQAFPEFNGSLRTVSERLEGPQGEESPLIFQRIVDRVVGHMARANINHAHSPWRVVRRSAFTGVLGVVTLCAALFSPGGIGGVAAWAMGSQTHRASSSNERAEVGVETARVGDVVLRYIYPSYTGLEPLLVPNGTGEAHGPPGTRVQVRLKSARAVQKASLIAYDDTPVEAAVVDGRELSAEFVIGTEAGGYRFVMQNGELATPSVTFPIEPELDLPPEVILDRAGTVFEVAVDDRLNLQWIAKDDFGIRRVDLEINGEVARTLESAQSRSPELNGVLTMRPLDLGLRAGNRVELLVSAWDNDEWSGQKVGRSRSVQLVVLGASGFEMMSNERRRQVRDILVDLLAGHLMDAWPPGNSAASLSKWGERVSRRYEPLQDLLSEFPAITRSPVAGRLVQKVMERGMEVVRFTQVSFDPFNESSPPNGSLDTTAGLRDEAIKEVEHSIVVLDRLIQQISLRNMVEVVIRLNGQTTKAESYAAADSDPMKLTNELGRVDNLLEQLETELSGMNRGSLRQFGEQRQREISALFREIGKLVSAKENSDASLLLRRASREVREFKEELEYRMKQDEDEENELQSKMKDLLKELQSLERSQRQLRQKTTKTREADNAQAAEVAASLWEQIEKKMESVQRQGTAYISGLENAGRLFFEIERARTAHEETSRLMRSVEARDLRKSFDNLNDALNVWDMVQRTGELERQRGRASEGPSPSQVNRVIGGLLEVGTLLERLNEVAERVSPELADTVQGFTPEQKTLEGRTKKAQELADDVAQKMPIQPRGLKESMTEAVEQMARASDALQEGIPLPAEGAQGQAADRLKEAQDALREAMQEMARQAQARSGQDSGSRSKSGEGDPMDQTDDIEIPSPEDFRTPEDYRRALLEGMQGDVPNEYRGMKKRYYEGLVKQ